MSLAGGQGFSSGLVRALRNAERVGVLTGSGISVESGVPTFREAQTGLWERYDPQQLATPEAFARDPRLVWEWYEWRRDLVREATPNPGHKALAELERRIPDFALVTQNVDGLHERAGSRNVVELHGNILRSRCSLEGAVVERDEHDDSVPPRCPWCDAYLRPDVVWFGEMPMHMDIIYDALSEAELFVAIGTSGSVYPAAGFVTEARGLGVRTCEINLEPSENARQFDEAWYGRASVVMPEWVEEILGS